ncbi:MAG TPA: carboxypeptidase-like regulatory domain-containing protein [Gemmatimonadaceae bacterium]
MRSRAAVFAICLLIPAHLAAQGPNTLRGRVSDETSRPVPFAQITLNPGDRRIVTDQNGDFNIASIADGEYQLRVRRIGFEPTTVRVRLPLEQSPFRITMTALPRILDSVRIRERGPVVRYTGIVIDDFDQPVMGAEVIAAGASDLGVRTDSAGHFRLLKAQKGTLLLRVRKFGYTPYFGSLSLRAEREDTVRVKRHPQGLPEAYILAESGFGRDTFAYIELDSRMRWKSSGAGIASREDLDRWADMDLCQALMRTPAASSMQLRESECSVPRCIVMDGLRPQILPLNLINADEVEAFEYHPRDLTGTIANRTGLMCNRRALGASKATGGFVVWLRRHQ